MNQILSNLRIVELGTDVATANVGRLFAAYGADVITIEPPGGHPIRHLPPTPNTGDPLDPNNSILFAYLGTGKRSVVLNLEDPADVAKASELVLSSDGIIDGYKPGKLASMGLDLTALSEIQPSLSIVQVTPFGQTGPYSQWTTSALTAYASGGQMYLTGDANKPPLLTAGHQAHMQASLHAFGALLTAIYAATNTGIGDIVDISIQEVQTATLEGAGPVALWYGGDQQRGGNNPRALWGVHPCKDGWIGVASMPRQTHSVLDVMGLSDMKKDPLFANSAWSPDADELLRILVPNFTMKHTAQEIFEIADDYRAPFAMIPTPAELLKWPHHKETDFWQEVTHPVLGKHPVPSGPIWFTLNPENASSKVDKGNFSTAPLLGQHNDEIFSEPIRLKGPKKSLVSGISSISQTLPLENIKVVDMTKVWSGPYAMRFLADMGADVIKVEGPTFPDPVRTAGGSRTAPAINLSSYFNEYNRGKRSLTLDFKKKSGMQALKRLIKTADVFVENWSSGVADRNGLGYNDLRNLNPNIVYISMPGFGHQGSDASRVGFGPTIEQMGGLVALQGYENDAPHKSGISYGDPIAGATCAGAAVAALMHKALTGKGCYCLLPQRDGVTGLIGEYIIAEALGCRMPTKTGNKRSGYAPHEIYPCLPDLKPRPILSVFPNDDEDLETQTIDTVTDRWIAINCQSDKEWLSLTRVVGDSRLYDSAYSSIEGRLDNQEVIDDIISEWTATKDPYDIANSLQNSGVTAAPVQTALLLLTDPHSIERENFVSVKHDVKGKHLTARPTWRLTRRPKLPKFSGPSFGQHNETILTELGYSQSEVAELEKTGATSRELIGNR